MPARYIIDIKKIIKSEKVEAALRLVQRSLDRAAISVFWTDDKARFLYVNDYACKKLGYSKKELLRMNVQDIDPVYTRPLWPTHWKQIRKKNKFSFESIHRRKDGTTFPVELTVNYLRYGKKEYNFAFASDISQRKEAEEIQQFLSSITEQSRDSIMITDLDYKIIYYNKATQELFGYGPDELLGKRPLILNAESRRSGVQQQIERDVAQGMTNTYELLNKRKDGTIFVCQFKVSPLRNKSGKIFGYIGIQRDITEARRAGEALKANEVFLQSIFDGIQDGISVLDKDMRVVRTNKWMEKMYSHAMPLAGNKCFAVYHGRTEVCP